MNTTEMTLERSFGKDFFPHSIKECEEDYIGENNWTENEGEYDSDLETNRDLVNSLHPYRNYPKKEGDRWKNGEPDSEHIELMTKKFLEDGGEIRVFPRTFSSGMNSVGYKDKVSNLESPLSWSEELNKECNWDRETFLTPFNVYSKRNDDDWNESNHLCNNTDYWTEMVSLYKEENPEWEMNEEDNNRLREIKETSSKFSISEKVF